MYRVGNYSVEFKNAPSIIAAASIVGPKEGEGPIGHFFDKIEHDMLLGKDSWEKAESELVRQSIELAVQKAKLTLDDIHYIFAGDLLNQISGSTFGVRPLGRPFFGLFGACSVMGSGISLGAMLTSGGFAGQVVACASSHFCSTEKTFRFPLELGVQRPPTAAWTVTGSGALVIAAHGTGPYIRAVTTGKIIDMGITDANSMGAAMAPAAAQVIADHLQDFGRQPSYYNVIATGDLGSHGSELLLKLLQEKNIDISGVHTDCGLLIFDRQQQDVNSGGSGCGCCAATFAGYFHDKLKNGSIKRMLFVPTGALHSAVTIQQGESIPAIAHAVAIESE